MKTKRFLAVILACAVAASLLAACGSSSPSGSAASTAPAAPATSTAQSPAASQENAKLDLMWFSDGVEGEVAKKLVSEYQVSNPHIQVNMIDVPYNDLENKLRISISGGEPPALARMTNVGAFKEVAVALDDYSDAQAWRAQFSDSLQPFYIYDGKMMGVPIDVTANGLIYNKTAFDKAGVSAPSSPDDIWTVEEWIAAMKEVMAKGDVQYGLVIDKTNHRYATLQYGQGGKFINEDQKSMAINDEAGVRTLELMKRLHDEKICPDSVWVGSENPNNMFRTGQVAMHLAGSWMMTNYRDNITDFEWGVTYLPIGTQRSSVPGGKYMMAFANSGVEQQAVDFLQYFSSTEANATYCQESLFISPRKDCANIEYSFGSEYFAIFANELENTPMDAARDWAHPTLSNAIKPDLLDGIANVISGKIGAQEMLDQIAEIGNEALEEALQDS